MKIKGFEGVEIEVEIGKTYTFITKGITNLVAGEIFDITEEYVEVETFDYNHKIKHGYIAEANLTKFEPEPETNLDILLKQKYVRVPSEALAFELIEQAKALGFEGWAESYPACDMYTSGHYVTILVQIK